MGASDLGARTEKLSRPQLKVVAPECSLISLPS